MLQLLTAPLLGYPKVATGQIEGHCGAKGPLFLTKAEGRIVIPAYREEGWYGYRDQQALLAALEASSVPETLEEFRRLVLARQLDCAGVVTTLEANGACCVKIGMHVVTPPWPVKTLHWMVAGLTAMSDAGTFRHVYAFTALRQILELDVPSADMHRYIEEHKRALMQEMFGRI